MFKAVEFPFATQWLTLDTPDEGSHQAEEACHQVRFPRLLKSRPE